VSGVDNQKANVRDFAAIVGANECPVGFQNFRISNYPRISRLRDFTMMSDQLAGSFVVKF
jgi:hypothetical protein